MIDFLLSKCEWALQRSFSKKFDLSLFSSSNFANLKAQKDTGVTK